MYFGMSEDRSRAEGKDGQGDPSAGIRFEKWIKIHLKRRKAGVWSL